jgi:hypothetical protein
MAPLLCNTDTRMEGSGVIRPLVRYTSQENDLCGPLNKIGGGLYSQYGGLLEKQDILLLLGIEPRYLIVSFSVLVNVPSRPSRTL